MRHKNRIKYDLVPQRQIIFLKCSLFKAACHISCLIIAFFRKKIRLSTHLLLLYILTCKHIDTCMHMRARKHTHMGETDREKGSVLP